MGAAGAAAGAAVVRAQHDLVQHLRDVHALDPASAVALPGLRLLPRRVLRRYVARGVIRRVDDRPADTGVGEFREDRYYLDEVRYSIDRQIRRRRAFALLVLAVLLGGALLYWTPRTTARDARIRRTLRTAR